MLISETEQAPRVTHAFFGGRKKLTSSFFGFIDRPEPTNEVTTLGLVAQVDRRQPPTHELGQVADRGRLSRARFSHHQDGLGERQTGRQLFEHRQRRFRERVRPRRGFRGRRDGRVRKRDATDLDNVLRTRRRGSSTGRRVDRGHDEVGNPTAQRPLHALVAESERFGEASRDERVALMRRRLSWERQGSEEDVSGLDKNFFLQRRVRRERPQLERR